MWIVTKVHQLNIAHAEVDKIHVTHAHKELAARFVKEDDSIKSSKGIQEFYLR